MATCSVSEIIEETLQRLSCGGESILPTGLIKIDQLIGGIQAKRIHLICGRPGIGVSTTIRSIVLDASVHNVSILYFTSGKRIDKESIRLLASLAQVSYSDIEANTLNDQQQSRVNSSKKFLSELDISLNDTNRLDELLAASEEHRINKPKIPLMIVIDNPIFLDRSGLSNQFSTGKLLHALALEINASIIMAAGLHVRCDKPNHYPFIASDINVIDDVADFSDVAIAVHREEVYLADTEQKGLGWLRVIKNNGGRTGCQQFAFYPEFSKIHNVVVEKSGGIRELR